MKIMMVIMLLMMVAITSRLASIQAELSDNQGRGFSRSCDGLVFGFLNTQVLLNLDSFVSHLLN